MNGLALCQEILRNEVQQVLSPHSYESNKANMSIDAFIFLLLAKVVAVYAFSLCKILLPENWVVYFLDKFQVC